MQRMDNHLPGPFGGPKKKHPGYSQYLLHRVVLGVLCITNQAQSNTNLKPIPVLHESQGTQVNGKILGSVLELESMIEKNPNMLSIDMIEKILTEKLKKLFPGSKVNVEAYIGQHKTEYAKIFIHIDDNTVTIPLSIPGVGDTNMREKVAQNHIRKIHIDFFQSLLLSFFKGHPDMKREGSTTEFQKILSGYIKTAGANMKKHGIQQCWVTIIRNGDGTLTIRFFFRGSSGKYSEIYFKRKPPLQPCEVY